MVFMAISPLVCKLKPPQPSIATLSVRLTVTLIASGRFVGMLPTSVAQFNAKRRLKISPIELPASWLAAGVITVKNRTHTPWVRSLSTTLAMAQSRYWAPPSIIDRVSAKAPDNTGQRSCRAGMPLMGRGRMTTK